MTYGFLGGLVIQKKGGKIKQQEIHTFNLIDEIHGALEQMDKSRHNDAEQIYDRMGRMKLY